MDQGNATGSRSAEIVTPAPQYDVAYDPELGLWAVMKAGWVVYHEVSHAEATAVANAMRLAEGI